MAEQYVAAFYDSKRKLNCALRQYYRHGWTVIEIEKKEESYRICPKTQITIRQRSGYILRVEK